MLAPRRTAPPKWPTGAGTVALIVVEPVDEDSVLFHLVPTRKIRVGYPHVLPGDPVCGTRARLERPGFLFLPDITCWMCAVIAIRDRITIEKAEGIDAA